MQVLSVFIMLCNMFWAYSHSVEVIDGFCRVVISNNDYRSVAPWNLTSFVCMFSWGIG